MLWALATLGLSPDPAWLQQHLREVGRRQAQRTLLPQHLANVGWALAKLSHRPDRDWLARYQEDVLAVLPQFKPQEISNVLWALAVLNCKAEKVGKGSCWRFVLCIMTPSHCKCILLRSVLLMFFRMLTTLCQLLQLIADLPLSLQRLLDQCQAYMAAHLAPSSKHQGVHAHNDCFICCCCNCRGCWTSAKRTWLRAWPHLPHSLASKLCSQLCFLLLLLLQRLLDQCQAYMAARLASFKANEVAVSLWALARLRGQPDLRLMGAALQHCFSQARQLTPKGLSMLMWSVGNMEIPPPKAWMVKLLVATQVGGCPLCCVWPAA
jgi:hypothetical protein